MGDIRVSNSRRAEPVVAVVVAVVVVVVVVEAVVVVVVVVVAGAGAGVGVGVVVVEVVVVLAVTVFVAVAAMITDRDASNPPAYLLLLRHNRLMRTANEGSSDIACCSCAFTSPEDSG